MNVNSNLDKDLAKRDRTPLAEALRSAGVENVDRKSIKCPFHDDKHPSAEIKQAASGNWYFYCYRCDISDDVWAITARIEGREVGDVLKDFRAENGIEIKPRSFGHHEKPDHQTQTKTTEEWREKDSYSTANEAVKTWLIQRPSIAIEDKYFYTEPESGETEFVVIRYKIPNDPKKKFRQLSKFSDGRWRWLEPECGRLPLYNRISFNEDSDILIVEGEKCVEYIQRNLKLEKLVATTCPTSRRGIPKTDISSLAGRTIWVWADNDDPGNEFAKDFIDALFKLDPPCRIRRVRIEDLGLSEKGDIVDFCESFDGTWDERTDLIEGVLNFAEVMDASAPIPKMLDRIREGSIYLTCFPEMPSLTRNIPALMPGTITTLVADPGSGKSFLVLQWFWKLVLEEKVSSRIMMLEDQMQFHLFRILSQMAGDSNFTQLSYLQAQPDRVQAAYDEHREDLETVARFINAPGSGRVTYVDILKWIKEEAEIGAHVLIVDPVTAVSPVQNQFIADSQFIFDAKALAEKYDLCLIFVTHPRGNSTNKPHLGGVAGGLAYVRFAQSVLWLQHYDSPQTGMMDLTFGTRTSTYNRTLKIGKGRSAIGSGRSMAMIFSHHTLCFEELGLLAPEKK